MSGQRAPYSVVVTLGLGDCYETVNMGNLRRGPSAQALHPHRANSCRAWNEDWSNSRSRRLQNMNPTVPDGMVRDVHQSRTSLLFDDVLHLFVIFVCDIRLVEEVFLRARIVHVRETGLVKTGQGLLSA